MKRGETEMREETRRRAEAEEQIEREMAAALRKLPRIRFRSVEEVLPPRRITAKFIPSREQH